jgi:hypothetical protein
MNTVQLIGRAELCGKRAYTSVVRRSVRARSHDDLFELFPDLPRPRGMPPVEAQRTRILNLVAAARARAAANVIRQQAIVQRVRIAVQARQQTLARIRR